MDTKGLACYRLHETMREYTGLKLREAGEEELVQLRCAEYYTSKCQQFAAEARYERTVGSHVRSILNKLGFNSRAQIAAWMASSNQ